MRAPRWWPCASSPAGIDVEQRVAVVVHRTADPAAAAAICTDRTVTSDHLRGLMCGHVGLRRAWPRAPALRLTTNAPVLSVVRAWRSGVRRGRASLLQPRCISCPIDADLCGAPASPGPRAQRAAWPPVAVRASCPRRVRWFASLAGDPLSSRGPSGDPWWKLRRHWLWRAEMPPRREGVGLSWRYQGKARAVCHGPSLSP